MRVIFSADGARGRKSSGALPIVVVGIVGIVLVLSMVTAGVVLVVWYMNLDDKDGDRNTKVSVNAGPLHTDIAKAVAGKIQGMAK